MGGDQSSGQVRFSNDPHAGLVQDVFGDWVDAAAVGSPAYEAAPVREIRVTEAMWRADAAERAARDAKGFSAWSIRETLSVANLVKAKPVLKLCEGGCGRRLAANSLARCGDCRKRRAAEETAAKAEAAKAERAVCGREGCGRGLRLGARQRTDGLCGRCGLQVDAAAKRLARGIVPRAAKAAKPERVERVTVAPAAKLVRLVCATEGCGGRLKATAGPAKCSVCRVREKRELRKAAKRICATAGCGVGLWAARPGTLCGQCQYLADAKQERELVQPRPCRGEGCTRTLRTGTTRTDGLCAWCAGKAARAARKLPLALCGGGCGARLYRTSREGMCGTCRTAVRRGIEPLAPRPECKREGCGATLRRGKMQRADGLCGPCGSLVDVKVKGKKGRHARWVAGHGATCAGCPKKIKHGTKTGLCKGCLGASRGRGTRLKAGSREEREADRLWAGLSAARKQALLEGRKSGTAQGVGMGEG